MKDMKKMSSCAEGKECKDSPLEGSREGEEAQRKRRPREGKPGGLEESPLPGDDPEAEPVGHCIHTHTHTGHTRIRLECRVVGLHVDA